MWELYDALINGIPENIKILDACSGQVWSYLESEVGTGVAMSLSDMTRPPVLTKDWTDMTLKEASKLIKSWNFAEASLGLCAINAWYNQPIHEKGEDAFLAYQKEVAGKNVAVIGHFPFLEKRFSPICNLIILERNPQEGDYPDTACEFLLPKQDYVFITGVTLVNKTLPRLLELSKNAKIILVGPSVPMATQLFDFGVDALESFQVEKSIACKKIVKKMNPTVIFSCGKMTSLHKDSNY